MLDAGERGPSTRGSGTGPVADLQQRAVVGGSSARHEELNVAEDDFNACAAQDGRFQTRISVEFSRTIFRFGDAIGEDNNALARPHASGLVRIDCIRHQTDGQVSVVQNSEQIRTGAPWGIRFLISDGWLRNAARCPVLPQRTRRCNLVLPSGAAVNATLVPAMHRA